MSLPKRDIVFVGVQFALFGLYLYDFLGSVEIVEWLQIVGIVLASVGVMVGILALLQLNKDLSPFPSPKSGSDLRTTGLYAIVRHPIYTGIILAAVGYGMYRESILKLVLAGALALLFHFKSKYEESLLSKQFKDYQDYQRKTGRLIPRLLYK